MKFRHVVITCLILEFTIEVLLPYVGLDEFMIAKFTKAVMQIVVKFLELYSVKEIIIIFLQLLKEHEKMKRQLRFYKNFYKEHNDAERKE